MGGLSAGLWTDLNAALRKRLGAERFDHLIRNARPLAMGDDELVFAVGGAAMREKLDRTYGDELTDCARAVIRRNIRVRFAVDDPPRVKPASSAEPAEGRENAETVRADPSVSASSRPSASSADLDVFTRMTFDAFLVHPGVQLAYRAARRFVETRGDVFSPLLLWGGPGTGKTHLLRALAAELRAGSRPPSVEWIGASAFETRFALAVQGGRLDPFRRKCRSADILILDDVHLLAHKPHSQEEFLHTFDDLVGSGRRLVISSLGHPRDLEGLSRPLRMRLRSGMEARLDAPDYPARLAWLRRLAAARSPHPGEEALEIIARRMNAGMKDLLACYRAVLDAPDPSPRGVGEVVDRFRNPRAESPTLADVARETAAAFGMEVAEISSRRRTRAVVRARRTAFRLARRLTRHSFEEIGRFFGGRDHSTVLLACRETVASEKSDPDLAVLTARIEKCLRRTDREAGASV